MNFLLDRLDLDHRDHKSEFTPLPYEWDECSKLAFRKSNAFAECLRMARTWLLNAPDGTTKVFWGPKLYAAVSSGYDDAVIADLKEWAFHPTRSQFDWQADYLRSPARVHFRAVGIRGRSDRARRNAREEVP